MASVKLQHGRGQRHPIVASNDSLVMKQVLATHAPDGREVDCRPLLRIVDDVFSLAIPTVILGPRTEAEAVDSRLAINVGVGDELETAAHTIHKISWQLMCKRGYDEDAHTITISLLNILANYAWDAKVVLVMAAFAVSYGEFWLTVQLHAVNPLAKSIGLLKQLPDMVEHAEDMKPRFDALSRLIWAMLDVAKCVVEFKELPSEYISADSQDLAAAIAHIPSAVYWVARSAVACASHVVSLVGFGSGLYHMPTLETWELSSLAHKLHSIHGHLTKLLRICLQHIDDKKHMAAYNTLVRLFETSHVDNTKILKTLFHSKDDHPLLDCTTKKKVRVDFLRQKIVLLLISDLTISTEELLILVQIYNVDAYQGRLERRYEIVWLPITDRHNPWSSANKDEAFHRLVEAMPWHSVHHPSMVDPALVRYAREMWHFDKKPLLVALDAQGKVVCPNAMYMICIWGSLAFPFGSAREDALWKEESWRLELIVDDIDPTIITWAREGRYVCLYGSEDMEWIRRFTTLLRRVAQEAKIPLETVYVGKSNPRERMKRTITAITEEKLSSVWAEREMIWFFWTRLESMWHSKVQQGGRVEDDFIMQEVMSLLSYDSGDGGWALIARGGTGEYVRAHGNHMVQCLGEFDTWKKAVETDGFLAALANALRPLDQHEHCTRLILPSDYSPWVRDGVVCADCRRPMEKYVLYRCCHNA